MKDNIKRMFKLIDEALLVMTQNLDKAYEEVDLNEAALIEKKINRFRDNARNQQVDYLKSKEWSQKAAGIYGTIISLSERTADYIVNVSEAIVEG